MNQYYLMAQLPSLDGLSDASPLPITEERFSELCERFLGRRAFASVDGLTLSPPREEGRERNRLIDHWNRHERQLRLALGIVRAAKRNTVFDVGGEMIPSELMQSARTAVGMDNPMEAERFLSRVRMEYLESLRPSDIFSEEMVYFYGLKLKLLYRVRQFDEAKGRAVYRGIYDSIIRGEENDIQS